MSTRRLAFSMLACFAALSCPLVFGAGVERDTAAPELRQEPLFELLRASATDASSPLEGIQRDPSRSTVAPGDEAFVLVDFESGKKTRQWLVGIYGKALTENDNVARDVPPMILYSSSGAELTFNRSPATVAIRILGPYQRRDSDGEELGRKAKDFWTGAYVCESFLNLGMDRACRSQIRFDEFTRNGAPPVNWGFRGVPYPTDVVERTRAQFDAVGITKDEEHSLAGMVPALSQFLIVALRTQDLGEVMLEMLDISKISFLLKGGKLPKFYLYSTGGVHALDARAWGLPEDVPVYALPMEVSVDGRIALSCTLAVTEPVAPLTVCSGIVGLTARQVDGNGDTLSLRLVSTRLDGK